VAFALACADAHAGSGPWALSAGDHALYVGVEAQRFRELAPVMGGELLTADAGGPVHSTGVKLAASVGLAPRVDAQVTIPYYRVEASVVAPGVCREFPGSPCRTTSGLGLVDVRTKWQLADELAGSPLSVAVGAWMRLGAHTQATRMRVTNLGEGTTDFGGTLSAGRTGRVGKGFCNAQIDAGYLHRTPTRRHPRGPRDEWTLDVLAHASPGSTVAVGPAVYAFWRPGGIDFDAVDLASPDRFSVLTVLNVRAGAALVIREPQRGLSLTASFVRTVVARNNPSDAWVASVGVGAHNPLRRDR
jgi:hypothetical protein